MDATGPVAGSRTGRWDGSRREVLPSSRASGQRCQKCYWSVLGRLEGRLTASHFPRREQGRSHRVTTGLPSLGREDSAGPGGLASVHLASLCQWEGPRDLGGG